MASTAHFGTKSEKNAKNIRPNLFPRLWLVLGCRPAQNQLPPATAEKRPNRVSNAIEPKIIILDESIFLILFLLENGSRGTVRSKNDKNVKNRQTQFILLTCASPRGDPCQLHTLNKRNEALPHGLFFKFRSRCIRA